MTVRSCAELILAITFAVFVFVAGSTTERILRILKMQDTEIIKLQARCDALEAVGVRLSCDCGAMCDCKMGNKCNCIEPRVAGPVFIPDFRQEN